MQTAALRREEGDAEKAAILAGVTELRVGDTCQVTKAGQWRLDGRVTKVHADGTVDVLLQDENITLTNKPPSEVRKGAFSRTAQIEVEAEQRRRLAARAEHSAARATRVNQSRACCSVLFVSGLALAGLSARLFVTAFLLRPDPTATVPTPLATTSTLTATKLNPAATTHNPTATMPAPAATMGRSGRHYDVIPDGMCELCVYIKYQGVVCRLWPLDGPRCHKEFMNYIYSASTAAAFAILVLMLPFLFSDRVFGIFFRGESMADGGRWTLHELVYPCCTNMMCWRRAWWCCGVEPSDGELSAYDHDVFMMNTAQSRVRLAAMQRML